MFKLQSFFSLSMLSFMLASSTALAGRIEDLGDGILSEEQRNAYIDKKINIEPQQETLYFQGQTKVKGAVPGYGDCSILSLQNVFPNKGITRHAFVNTLENLLRQGNEEVKEDLASELNYQLVQQHLYGEPPEFKGIHIDNLRIRLKANFDNVEKVSELSDRSTNGREREKQNTLDSINKIKEDENVLLEILESLRNPKNMLSVHYEEDRLGTMGIACKLFKLNLQVYNIKYKTREELYLYKEFKFGGEEPTKSILFKQPHFSPLADLDDYETRQNLANYIYKDMMANATGLYQTVLREDILEAMHTYKGDQHVEQRDVHQYDERQYDEWKEWQENVKATDDHYASLLGQLEATSHPQDILAGFNNLTVITDHNADANYQLCRKPQPVAEADLLLVYYRIVIQDGGKMALGWLNTAKDGWYGRELILGPGEHKGFYKRIVPAGEKEASLVLRNYHLKTPGETTFTVEALDFEKKDGLKSTVFPKQVIKDDDGKITVTTDENANANYQLCTIPYAVAEDDILMVHYKIRVQLGGRIALGWLNTAKNGWYGSEFILGPGEHKGIYKRIVPAGEKEASLVFRNYHLKTPGESTFTVEYYDVGKEGKVKLKSTGLSKEVIKHDNGKITVTTDKNANANYQLKTDLRSVKEGDVVQVPYKITVQPGGKMSLGLLNTEKNGWYGEELVLTAGKHKGLFQQRVPIGEKETSLIIRNAHLGTSGETTFKIKDIDLLVAKDFFYMPEYNEAETLKIEEYPDFTPKYNEAEVHIRRQFQEDILRNFVHEQEQLLPFIEDDHERNCMNLTIHILKYEVFGDIIGQDREEGGAKIDQIVSNDPLLSLLVNDRFSSEGQEMHGKIGNKLNVFHTNITEIIHKSVAKKKADLLDLYGGSAEVKSLCPHFDTLFDHLLDRRF